MPHILGQNTHFESPVLLTILGGKVMEVMHKIVPSLLLHFDQHLEEVLKRARGDHLHCVGNLIISTAKNDLEMAQTTEVGGDSSVK